jgi:hypothetical protein
MNLPIIQQFKQLHQDAVLWKSSRLWSNAQSPDEQAIAIQQLVELLYCILNETKRNSYIKLICEEANRKVNDNKRKLDSLLKAIDANSKLIGKLRNKLNKKEDEQKQLYELEKQNATFNEEVLALQANKTLPISEKELLKLVNEHVKQIKAKLEEAARKKAFQNTIGDPSELGFPQDFKGNKNDVFDALKYGIYIHDDVFFSRGAKGDYAISNFTMKIIYHIPTNDDTSFRLISVKNVWGFEKMININTDDFVSCGSFKKILARQGDFVFKGTDSDLSRLSEYLQKDEVSAKRIDTLGWNKALKFWAWSNGITIMHEDNTSSFIPVDDYGIVPFADKKFFIPANSMMYREKDGLFVNEKKFIYSTPIEGVGFEQWALLMYKSYQKKSIAAILFYVGSLFRDIMMKKIRRYPLLNLFGPPGAGKGEMYDSLMHMFGHKQDQIMLGGATTAVGLMRKFAQFCNALVGADEYKNNLATKIIESLKNLYDGIGYERGKMTNDFTTESTPVNSSTILLGQDMPTIEPALFMRCILLAFEEGKFTAEQREHFGKLKELEPHGLAYITADLLKFRNIFDQSFKDNYSLIFKGLIKDVANVEIDDRMYMNIAILLTCMHLTKDHLKYPFEYAEAKDWLIENMKVQHSILAGNNDVSKFWSIVESLFYRDEIHDGKDFQLEDGYIFIKLQQVHPFYVKEMIARRDMNYLGLPTLRHYLSLDKTIFVSDERKRFKDGSNTNAYKLKYGKLKIDLIKLKQEALENDEQFAQRYAKHEETMATPKDDRTAANITQPIDDLPF